MLASHGVTLVSLVGVINQIGGTTFQAECLNNTWQNIVTLGLGISAAYGRFKAGGVDAFGARK